MPQSFKRAMVFGPISEQYRTVPDDHRTFVLAELTAPISPSRHASAVIDAESSASTRLTFIRETGESGSTIAFDEPVPTVSGAFIDSRYRQALRMLPAAEYETLCQDTLAPLMLLECRDIDDHRHVDVLVPAKLTMHKGLFVRVASTTVRADRPLAEFVHMFVAEGRTLREYVNNDRLGYVKAEDDMEIETKITVNGDCSIWELATGLYQRIHDDELAGFRCEFGDEFQRWERPNQMFEVLDPPQARGYVSFIRHPNGTSSVKHKTFTEDTLRRREEITHGVHIPDTGFDGYLATNKPDWEVRRMPEFSRVRFDINVESITSGHVYSISIDESITDEPTRSVLRQIEIEYVRSRIHDGLDNTLIYGELDELNNFIEEHLRVGDLKHERGFLSKLTFFRQHLDGNGDV